MAQLPKNQFNVRLPASLVDRIRADARRSGRSIDSVIETILTDFLKGWTVTERQKFYGTQPAKRLGRPIEGEETKVR